MNQFVSKILLLVAFVTIPWMLLVNPFLQWTEERNRNKRRESQGGDVELDQFKGEYEQVSNDIDGDEFGR